MRKNCFKRLATVLALLVCLGTSIKMAAQAVIFPQEKQAGTAVVKEVVDGYTIGNDLFIAKFVKADGKITFGGCEELGLIAGSEIFKVQLANGTEIPASEFTLVGDVEVETLTGNSAAAKGAYRFNGQQLKAQLTHAGSGLTIEWRAVLRDGSHYLRTEMDIKNTGENGIEMNSITPMMYTVRNIDGEKAPAVVGNTRGAVIASDKIFAGLETPMGIQTSGATTDLETFVFQAWDGEGSWGWMPEAEEIPAGIQALSQYAAGTVKASRGYLVFREAGEQTITFQYTEGNNRLQILGADLINLQGTIVASDYHFGYTGGAKDKNVYTLNVPQAGAYMVRLFVTNNGSGEGYGSKGTITYSCMVKQPALVYDLASTATPYLTPEVQTAEKPIEITPEEGSLTATQAKQTQWTSGLSQFANWTEALPEGMSTPTASAIFLDKHYTIEAGRLNVTFDYTSGSHGLNILGVQLIDAQGVVSTDYHVGFTGGSDRNNVYSVVVPKTGDYIVRLFADRRADGVQGNGNIDFALTAFANKVTTAAGATDTWTSAWTGFANWTGTLPTGTAATGTAKFIDKQYHIEAGKLNLLFDYTGGNHGLYMLGVQLIDHNNNIVAQEFKNGFTGSNSTVAYSVNVIKEGYYTVRYIADYCNGGTDTNGDITLSLAELAVLGTLNEGETIAHAWTPADWKTMAAEEVPNRVNEVGCTDENARLFEQQITITSAGQLTVEFDYQSGSHKLILAGVELVGGNSDFHAGETGSADANNIYKFNVEAPGTYALRYYANNIEEINSTGEVRVKLSVDYTLHLIASETTPITGKWSRMTTLKAGEKWDVAAVVGLIAPGQARRSFLCYSERERAVPWRAAPTYVSWYELNINHNNAAPGSEHENSEESEYLAIVNAWKEQLYDKHGEAPYAFVWDDGWDKYGEWQFHDGLPNGFTNIDNVGRQMGAGQGAWLGPVGGYGTSGGYRRAYWNSTKTGGMQLSNPLYYDVFVKAVTNLLYDYGYDFRFFKFDGISGQFSAVGPDAGATGQENAEAIIMAEKVLRSIKADVFLNTSVGTWASPFWFQFTDAVWRQEKDYGTAGNNSVDRENWITYRDRLVYQNFVQNSPLCPINTLMTHGFILTGNPDNPNDGGRGGWTASRNIDYKHALNELRCAFACGSGMVELYNDVDLTNHINGGALWKDIADCMKWQRKNADVLPDIHWVGGNPWTGSKAEIYGWAAWNAKNAVLTLRNGANSDQQYTFTLREALDIPAYVNTTITLTKAFADQVGLTGLEEGTAIDIDTKLTVTLPGSSVYVFDGVDNTPNVTIPAIISEHKMGTFYANEAVQIPADVTAYVALSNPVMEQEGTKEYATGVITMTPIMDGIVPAKTGVLICGEQGTYYFTSTTDAGTPIEGNLMKGYAGAAQYETVTLPEDATTYILSVKNGTAGFYKKDKAFKVYNNKSYLQVPTNTMNALRIRFGEESDPTAIPDILLNGTEQQAVYDLQGRRVQTPGKGIYIVGGKKVVY